MTTIIYPSVLEWSFLFQRAQQLMLALARQGFRVCFLTPRRTRQLAGDNGLAGNDRGQLTGSRRLTAMEAGGPAGIDEVAPGVFVCRRTEPPAGLLGDAPVLWLAYPPYVDILGRYREQLVVYDAVDLPEGEFRRWAPFVPVLRAAADVVFAVSPELVRENTRHPSVHLCPNGADYAHFARAATEDLPVPADMAALRRPVVGFYGALSGWVDWGLLDRVAESLPDFSFVCLGPTLFGQERGELPQRPNLHYLGHVAYEEIPAYLRCFDVAILPFRLTPVTRASDPVKLYEYLAAGKPIIATPLPAVRRLPTVCTAATAEDFARQIKRAIAHDSAATREERMRFARENTWDKRAELVRGVLERALAGKV